MLNKKEIFIILIVSIILALAISLTSSEKTFESFRINYGYSLVAILCVILVNVVAKKIMAYMLDTKIEIKLWEMQRYWFKASDQFKKPIVTGLIFPIVITVLSAGYVKWLASITFDVESMVYRAAKRYGIYKFSEVTEYHIGLIAVAGVFANLVFAFLGYLIAVPLFAKLSLLYALWCIVPFSSLDGSKILFGSKLLWIATAIITAVCYIWAVSVI